ncbi:MAG: YbaB/EbfC family nucleoid-associated protein [Candidatus Wallbacteria bacterium]|nr:YbaB/EbfC family nucleoid-associated protein [Candidatus Wallbacteria bacterium]
MKGPFQGGNMGNLLKQAQKMQGKMLKMQEDLENLEIEGTSGGGMVKVTLNGKGVLRSLKISPETVDPQETEMLEDLIIAAFNDAHSRVEEAAKLEMEKISGGMPLPGLF